MSVLHTQISSAGRHRRAPRIEMPAPAPRHARTVVDACEQLDRDAELRQSAGATLGLVVLAYVAIEAITARHLTEMFGDAQ